MLSERRFMTLKWAVSNGSVESTIFILEKLKELNYDDFTKDPESFIKGMIDFASTSDAMSDQDKSKMVESLKNLMKNQSGDNVKESRKLNSFSEFKVK